jgi:hypothetical protein
MNHTTNTVPMSPASTRISDLLELSDVRESVDLAGLILALPTPARELMALAIEADAFAARVAGCGAAGFPVTDGAETLAQSIWIAFSSAVQDGITEAMRAQASPRTAR